MPKFKNLSDDAKEVAREWWRTCEAHDFHGQEYVFDDAKNIGEIIGIDLDETQIPLMNGKTRPEPKIYWSGFSSPGDGACFEASYQYKKGCMKALKAYAPKDKSLHAICKRLIDAQRPFFYGLSASTNHSGHYYHSGCMSVSVDVDTDCTWQELTEYAESEITDALREFADWIYRQLEKQWEHVMSDENVDKSIMTNDYKFHKDGTIK